MKFNEINGNNEEIKKETKDHKLTFDQLILEKYKEDGDLDFQRWYKDNRGLVHQFVHNNIKYSDIEIFSEELPITIEDPLIGSIYHLLLYVDFTDKESNPLVNEYNGKILNHTETVLDYIDILNDKKENTEGIPVGGYPIDINTLTTETIEENYFSNNVLFDTTTNTFLFDEGLEGQDDFILIGKIALLKSYILKKYSLEKYEDFDFNLKTLVKDTMKIFIDDALNTFYNKKNDFKAITIDINSTYIDSENKRQYIDEYIELKPEFEKFYNPNASSKTNREMLIEFMKNFKFCVELGEKFNTKNTEKD